MKLLNIPLKNITINKKRTFALFMFMMVSAFFMIIFINLVETINSNMMHAMTDSITGNVQIRPADTEEKEMISFSESWSQITVFEKEATSIVNSIKGTNCG